MKFDLSGQTVTFVFPDKGFDMLTEMFTPHLDDEPVELSSNRFRKQILPFGTINYKGQKITFDKQFCVDLVNSYKSGAVDQVPFQLATPKNEHNNDPQLTRGELAALEVTDRGLFGEFTLNDAGAELVRTNKRLGVSARILQGMERSDGKKFPRVLQHVLGTVDPHVTGMAGWEELKLSSDHIDVLIEDTLDLSRQTYEGSSGMPNEDTEKKSITLELSTAQLEKLQSILSAEDTDEDEDELTAEELEALDAELEDEDDTTDSDNLALARADAAESKILELTAALHTREVEAELERLRSTGLAPAIIEAARPILEMPTGVIELSSTGASVDVGAAMRDVLAKIVDLAGTHSELLDLDVESGVLVGTDSVQARRSAFVDQWEQEYGN